MHVSLFARNAKFRVTLYFTQPTRIFPRSLSVRRSWVFFGQSNLAIAPVRRKRQPPKPTASQERFSAFLCVCYSRERFHHKAIFSGNTGWLVHSVIGVLYLCLPGNRKKRVSGLLSSIELQWVARRSLR